MTYTTQEEAFMKGVGGRQLVGAGPGGIDHWDFGWVAPENRSDLQRAFLDAIMAKMPRFQISGTYRDTGRVALWKAGVKLLGRHLPYNWQLTGSCVGAGGGNMLKTLMAVEIAIGNQAEQYEELWWPFTYGRSRLRSGMSRPGEGSTGTGWAEAITDDGSCSAAEAGNVPAFREVDGWLQLTEATEYSWSDGDASQSVKLLPTTKKHLVKTAAPIRNSSEARDAIANGYPLTQASNFGFRPMVPSPQGNPPVRLVTWNGSWSHQTYLDEVWEHPTLGLIFRWGNNWGPDAHGPALADEPASSVYISAKTLDDICSSGEVYAFSAYDGFPSRDVPLDWTP